jgi:hypothetical protein
MSLAFLSGIFLLTVAVMALAVSYIFARYLDGRPRATAILVLLVWLVYAGILGYTGIVALRTPPGPLFLIAPVVIFLATFVVRNPGVKPFVARLPVPLLIGLQVDRVAVEAVLYGLNQNHLIPRMLTFEGANFDIVIGISAPLVAWLYATGRVNKTAARVWNVAGILLLANVIARSMLTFAGLVPTEVPNQGIGMFPFSYLPGFLAPLAVYLHVLLGFALSGRETVMVPAPDGDDEAPATGGYKTNA